MTENPYAAPESISPGPQLSPAAAGVRAVSKGFRAIGWIGVVGYGPGTVIWIILWIYSLIYEQQSTNNPSPGVTILEPLAYAGLAFLSWMYIRTGRRLLTLQPGAYRAAMLLSCLLVIAFPLAPLGIYCLIKLRKHWRPYCEEQAEISRSNP